MGGETPHGSPIAEAAEMELPSSRHTPVHSSLDLVSSALTLTPESTAFSGPLQTQGTYSSFPAFAAPMWPMLPVPATNIPYAPAYQAFMAPGYAAMPAGLSLVPRAPPATLEWPDSASIGLAWKDIYLPRMLPLNGMLLKDSFSQKGLFSLVPASVLLASIVVGGSETPSAVVRCERTLFRIFKSELMALLDRGEVATVDTQAALANITNWAFHRGLNGLGRQFLDLSDRLLVSGGYVQDLESFRPTALPSWDEAAAAVFGTNFRQRKMDANELEALRKLWLDYYLRNKLVHFRLFWRMLPREWSRKKLPLGFDLNLLRLPLTPPPAAWDAAEQRGCDPRTLPIMPHVADILFGLQLDPTDPQRPAAMKRMVPYMTGTRDVLIWIRLIMRREVDRFLASCRSAGLASPAQLPLDLTSPEVARLSPTLQSLTRHRTILDATIIQLQEAFPAAAQVAVREGDPRPFLNAHTVEAGSFILAHTDLTRFSMIALFRLELYSSLGVIFSEDARATAETLSRDRDLLAIEFGRGELFSQLLESALAFTRLVGQLVTLQPVFYQYSAYIAIFSVFCIHASLYGRIRRSLATMQPGEEAFALASALSEVERNANVCLNAFDRASHVMTAARTLADLGRKMLADQRIDPIELAESMFIQDANFANNMPNNDVAAAARYTREEAEHLRNLLMMYASR